MQHLYNMYAAAANLCNNTMDFRGFDSSTILILRGGIPRPIGNFPESLSQAILVGIMLVGRLGVVGVSEPVVTGAPQTQHPLRPQVFRGLIGTGLMGTYLLIITSDLETDKIEPRS